MSKKEDVRRLKKWQNRLSRNQTAYQSQYDRMDKREALYRGENEVTALVAGDKREFTPHVRNICAELVESQVSSSIPQPKVTARRKQDEGLAKLIEDMIRNELDRMPFEVMNDMRERTVPIQGGAAWLVEWDNNKRTHTTVGEVAVSSLHPKSVLPQDGVYTGVEDMDYIILKVPQTKGYIQRQYGVDVHDETEQEPDIRGDADTAADDMVTLYIGYQRNNRGGIDRFCWVNDTIVEDLEDYQARRLRRCKQCGALEPMFADPMPRQTLDGTRPDGNSPIQMLAEGLADSAFEEETRPRPVRGNRKACPYCGGTKWEERAEEYEEVYMPIKRSIGPVIPGLHVEQRLSETVLDEFGQPVMEMISAPTRIPLYRPDIYPVIMQKNISVHGRFLGGSDIDAIENQQNTTNQLSAKIVDKLFQSGTLTTLPPDAMVEYSPKEGKTARLTNPAELNMIKVFNLEGDIAQDMAYKNDVYEEARQGIGVTDSFQGRRDPTATSGKAKEFSAAQTAGRLESKRVMKNAAYAQLFEAIFKFKLAYADEPRPVVSKDIHGNSQYQEFNRYDFLEIDEAGEYFWNDQFLFSCDTTAPLASNREAMWQETRMNLESGAFGDPTQLSTLILFWSKMEILHYPDAGATKKFLEEELHRQQQTQQMMAQIQQLQSRLAAVQAEQAARGGTGPGMERMMRQAPPFAAADTGKIPTYTAPASPGAVMI